jgi:hypothetical protein
MDINAIHKFTTAYSFGNSALILSTIGAEMVLKNKELVIQAKRQYLPIEKRGNEAIMIQEQYEKEEKIYGKTTESSFEKLINQWSSLVDEVRNQLSLR